MAENVRPVSSSFEMDIAGFQRSMERIQRSAARLRKHFGETEKVRTQAFSRVERSTKRVERSANRASRSFVRMRTKLASVASVATGIAFLRLAQRFESVDAGLEAVTGSAQKAEQAQSRLSKTALDLSINNLALQESYVGVLGAAEDSAFSQADVEKIMKANSVLARVFSISNDDLRLSFRGLTQAMGQTNVMLEELRQFSDPLPGGLNRIAQALNMSGGEFRKWIETAKPGPREVLIPWADATLKRFLPSIERMNQTSTAAFAQVTNAWQSMARAFVDSGALQAIANSIRWVLRTTQNAITAISRWPIARTLLDPVRMLRNELRSVREEINKIEAIENPLARDTKRLKELNDEYFLLRRQMTAMKRERSGARGAGLLGEGPGITPPASTLRNRRPAVPGSAFATIQEAIRARRQELQMMRNEAQGARGRRGALLRGQGSPVLDLPDFTQINRRLQQLSRVRAAVTETFETIGNAVAQSAIGVARGTQTMSDAFQNFAQTIASTLLSSLIQRGIRALGQLALSAIPGGGAGAAGSLAAGIPGLAGGGVVRRPTLALLGERGANNPEFVLNRQQMQAMQAPQVTVINVADNEQAQRVAALEAAQGRQVQINQLARSVITEGNGNPLVQSLRAVMGR